jgi:hypothetical protein
MKPNVTVVAAGPIGCRCYADPTVRVGDEGRVTVLVEGAERRRVRLREVAASGHPVAQPGRGRSDSRPVPATRRREPSGPFSGRA